MMISLKIYHVVKEYSEILHAFKKKSPKGIKTPQQTIDLIHQRLQTAIQISQTRES